MKSRNAYIRLSIFDSRQFRYDTLSARPARNTKYSHVRTHCPCRQVIGGVLYDTFTCVVSPMPSEMIGRDSGFLSRYEFLSLAMLGNKYPAFRAPRVATIAAREHPLPATGPLPVDAHSRPWDAEGGGGGLSVFASLENLINIESACNVVRCFVLRCTACTHTNIPRHLGGLLSPRLRCGCNLRR